MNRKIYTHIFIFLSTCLAFSPLHSANSAENKDQAKGVPKENQPADDHKLISHADLPGYTINFENVSIIEYLNFISKIAKVNLIYKEEDLNFKVTIISEEPTNLVNIMAALTQILKINGLSITEQGNNLLISQSGLANQIATVISSDSVLKEGEMIPPIITYVFKVKKANPTALGQMIRPFISQGAMMEIAEDSRHLIITDITQNIEEIKKLLLILDAPEGSLEISSFIANNNSPEALISLAKQIITPIAERNTYILVPQANTNAVYIVSTPFLIEKTKSILQTLDSTPEKKLQGPISPDNILIYHIKNKPANIIQKGVQNIETNLNGIGPSSKSLVETLKTMKYIKENHSLFFTGSASNLSQVKSILEKLDTPYTHEEVEHAETNYFVYKIKNADEPQIARSLEKFVAHMKTSPHPDSYLIQAIDSMKWVKENNSLIFSGDPNSIEKIKKLLLSFDLPPSQGKTASKLPLSNKFFIYKPKHHSGEELLQHIQDTYKNLKDSGLADPALLNTLNSAKWAPDRHSLIFTGDSESITQLKEILNTMDASTEHSSVFIYTLKHIDPQTFEKSLKNLEESLPEDSKLRILIESVKHAKGSSSFVFKGSPSTINKIKEIIPTIDNAVAAQEEMEGKQTYFVYQLKHIDPQTFEKSLRNLEESLPKDSELRTLIESVKHAKGSSSFVFEGSPSTINKIKEIIPTIDNPAAAQEEMQGKQTYFVYKLKHSQGSKVLNELTQIAESFKTSDESIYKVIKDAKWIQSTNSIVLIGPTQAVEKVKAMIAKDDTEHSSGTFFVYKPKTISIETLKADVKQSIEHLKSSGFENPDVIQTLESMQIDTKNNSAIFSGTPESIEKVKSIVSMYDHSNEASFFVYSPEHISANKLKEDAYEAANGLKKSGLNDPGLIQALESAHVDSKNNRVTFSGTESSISKLKPMIKSYDTKEAVVKTNQFYIFKPAHRSPSYIIKEANHTASEMNSKGLENIHLINALKSGTIVSNGSAVLFTGTSSAIESLKAMVKHLDTEKKETEKASNVYIYLPVHISADDLRRHARMVAGEMVGSNFSDPQLIQTLQSAQLVSNGKSVLFTGTEDSITKLKDILPSIDTSNEDDIKAFGNVIFKIYNIKHIPAVSLMQHLRNAASDLARSDKTDVGLAKTINNMRYVKESNSIVFTGTKNAVFKAIALAEQFDVKSSVPQQPLSPPTTYSIYKPRYLPGEDLIHHVREFEQNLVTSGVKDQGLFDTIQNMRWMEKNSHILVSGEKTDVDKTIALLERFDVAGPEIPKTTDDVESVADLSFLVYKLQYHKGEEIQRAIMGIGAELKTSKSKSNENLSEAIQSLKYIELTNSLIATGQPSALKKLKELIKSVDVPQKQVFVEVLVIQTSVTNALAFGLNWGSQGNYQNKFVYRTGLFNNDGGLAGGLNSTNKNGPQGASTGDSTSSGQSIGSALPSDQGGGGVLGVLGDIITHKGNSYYGLGSLVTALESDAQTTILLNQKLITQDNKNSTLFIGQNIPFAGSFVENQTANTITTQNLEYRDVGINLSITPTVGLNNTVTLDISQDISTEADTKTNVGPDLTGITTDKNQTNTVVTVPNNAFVAVSGQISNQTTRTKVGIPCLGGLPLVGAAFNDLEKSKTISNVIMFVKPSVMTSFQTYKDTTERVEEVYKSMTNDDEDFDYGLEMIKSPDDP